MKKVIYDFGSNNGDDIPYYLKKADLVVAVEANPLLGEQIRKKFSNEISQRRLVLENFVLTDGTQSGNVSFYRHKKNNLLSQFPKPLDLENFDEILLPSKSVVQIITEHGSPHFIKIDIEHYDEKILRALFENDIRPSLISAESHSIEVFSLLVALGKYNAFKLVEGNLVSQIYQNHQINTINGLETYSFPHHSAGPFGEDINGQWMTANNFFRLLGFVGLGWKDIHATNIDKPNPNLYADLQTNISVIFKDKN